MRATRRTFRTAAVATGAIAALAVPTTAAFAADTPPSPQGQITPDDRTGATDQDQDQDQTGQDQDQDKSKDADTDTDKGKDTDTDTETPKPGSWESKGITDLGKGWTAKVDVNASARTAKAALSLDGTAKGSLTAYEKSASTSIDGNTFTLTPDGTATAKLADKGKDKEKDKDKDKPVPGGWVSKGTTDLGKGWTAKVDVNASARSAKAEIRHDDSVKGSLKAYINPSKTKIDGCTFTLTADGTITRTGAKPQPDGKRVHVRTAKLADGSTAKIYKLGQNHYQADIYAKGVKLDTLDANGKSATGQNNGLHVVLNPDGTIKSWVGGKTGPAQKPQQHHKPQQHKTGTGSGSTAVPKGGVKAGAEGLHPAGESTPLIAAGGGMAALGAAGLGFALYRRKQND
ncbi:hypothetical protein ACFQ7F_40325 [Streptomyces sp. NPDC056486]|uniref:hypothetical protein n=1 Tax=Streptomyces sp. NPDC056486 TaxID=3345835 RepID=UPI00367E4AE7